MQPSGSSAVGSNNCLQSHNSHSPQHQSSSVKKTTESKSVDAGESPDGLKRFVDRCLSPCSTQAQKDAILREVQTLIQKALMDGSFQTKDWDHVPLIQVEGSNQSCSVSQQSSSIASVTPKDRTRIDQQSSIKRKMDDASEEVGYGIYAAASSGYNTQISGYNTQSYQSRSKVPRGSRVQHQSSYYGPSSDFTEEFVAVPSSTKKKSKSRGSKEKGGLRKDSATLNQRAQRFSGPGGLSDAMSSATTVSGFDQYMGKKLIGGRQETLSEADFEAMTCKGTSQVLDKAYLRLTAPPRPELVRPRYVLEQHLKNLKAERDLKETRRDYTWFCSQLKAVRQDCTVQRIKDAFAVDVYETHARIALSEGDLNEFNQCQTQLKELYFLLQNDAVATKNRVEFLSYRLIYYVFLTGNAKYQGGSSDLFALLYSLTPSEKVHPSVKYALRVREAVAQMNYHAFFGSLLPDCPTESASHLMDFLVPAMRHNALLRIVKAFRPTVETLFVVSEIGLDQEKQFSGMSDSETPGFYRNWLESCGCILSEDGQQLITKDCVVRESDLEMKKSLI